MQTVSDGYGSNVVTTPCPAVGFVSNNTDPNDNDASVTEGSGATCNLDQNLVCPASYEEIAGYCSTSHAGCAQGDCQTFVSGFCGLFPPEE